MDHLKDIILHCHQRHKKPFRQRKTKVTPALHKAMPYHFTVYCAHRYPVKLHDLEQANISFMPIGLAPVHESGPKDFGGERFLKRQSIEDWKISLWHQSFGIQMYTGVPSEQDGAQWHDINFTYQAICVAPDAVYACIETLVNTVANPLLTISKSGGLRFSCRVQNYLHPNTEDSKQYIYKDTWAAENSRQRDVYLEILGDKRYNQWDARHEILLGNLLEPPVISKEVLFAPIDALRAALHEPTPFDKKSPEPITQTASVTPLSLGSYNLDLAKEAFLHRGFSYFRQDGDIHLWHKYTGKVSDEHVSLWENEGTVWVRASAPNIGLPMEATPIVAVWDNTGILSPLSTAGLPVSEQVLAVREGKLSPLAIKRPPAVLHKPENVEKIYDDTLEKNATQVQRVFNETKRILGLIADRGSGKNYGAETYVLNGGAINLNGKPWEVEGVEQGFKQNVSSIIHMRSRMFRWKHAKDIPAEARMAAPFQHGNLCEDPERCDALERKGGNPLESICPECPVYTACQDRGYLSQFDALQHAKVQISEIPQLFFNPQQKEIVEEMLKQVDKTERLCIADEVETHELFLECNISKGVLEEWWVNWQGNTLGNFARALLNALETKGDSDDNPVRRIRASMQAFEGQTEELISQMCQANVQGRVTERGMVDDETGNELARFTIEFEGGTSAYIPLDAEAADRLRANGLPFFALDSFVLNTDMRIGMQMSQAIKLGILDTSTVENIRTFPTVYSDPNWTLWHQLKHFLAYYTQDLNAPMVWYKEVLKFWAPPVLHNSVKRLLLMSSTLSERTLSRTFPDEESKITHLKPTAWIKGNKVFQIRAGIYNVGTLSEYPNNWDILGGSKLGCRLFSGIFAEIERDLSTKHAIITHTHIVIQQLADIAKKENVCFVRGFKKLERPETAFEEAQVVWIVGTPYWEPRIIWRRAQILFGNDEKPLSYEIERESCRYKDERVQSVYEQHVTGVLRDIVGHAGLNRLSGKTVVLVTNFPLPDITDRPETLLFDWEDFEVAGGLDKLPEVIAERERFETERATLTTDTSRIEVERILGCSSRQANRVLNKLRGGNIPRVLFREQIFSLLANGEKKTAELVEAIEGHPTSVRNELKRLLDAGEIVKIRWGIYALPKPVSPTD